jgi:hypothetical protein
VAKQLSQAAIKAKADEWAEKKAAIAKAETARSAAIDPIIARHNEELEPVLKRHDSKIEKLQAEADEIYAEVIGWLEEKGVPTRVEGEKAVAAYETGTKLGPRVINVKQFLEVAKPKGEAMYECIQIGVACAEKLIGKKELDQIATRPESPTKNVTLKLKN